MVDNLSISGRHVEVLVHFIIVERADSRRSQSKRFRSKIERMADSARFKMHVAITSVAIMISGTFEIANHRKAHASVTSEVLTKAESSRDQALVAVLGFLQPGKFR